MITQKSIEELKNRIDIVDIISRYISVKKSGRNYVCVCPFHDDVNPSMSINTQDNFYHCFACKAGGDAITFVMEYEKISYPEAIEKIAAMINFTLEYDNVKSEFKVDKKILQIANAYFQASLYENEAALKYLYSRGFDDGLIRYFGIGWAGSSEKFMRVLQNEEISLDEALNVGIIKRNENGVYASFIERITFPIKNHASNLIGFGGRTISNHPAKYVNSPQSAVFDKSRVFYAYDLAKPNAIKKKSIIITEGYMDTIMLHKAGINNAIAVLGTALTSEHLPLLRRLECDVILSFDGDTAGINAALKSATLLLSNQIDCNVVIIPQNLDPADMVVSGRIEELENLYANGTEGGAWVIQKIASEFDLNRPINRANALEAIAKFTRTLPSVVAQGYVNLVENLLSSRIDDRVLIGKTNFKFETNKSANPSTNLQISQGQNSGANPGRNDYLELGIIKTALKNSNFLSLIKDIASPQSFFFHKELFDTLCSGEKNEQISAIFRELLLNDSVMVLRDENELKFALIALQGRFLNAKKELVRRSDEPNKLEILMQIEKELRILKGMR